jgi:hypothetical protein
MEGLVALARAALIVLLAAAVWRLWALCAQVTRAGEAARGARASMGERERGVGTPVVVYPVDLHALSAASPVAVVQARPDEPGGGRKTGQAIPLLMLGSAASNKLGNDVAVGAVTHVIAGAVIFEVSAEGAWEAGGEGGWSRPGNSSDVLVWARPLSEESAKLFPFPALKQGGAIQLPDDAAEHGYVSSLVLAF